MLGDVVAFLPKLLAFLAILIIGYFVAKALDAVLERVVAGVPASVLGVVALVGLSAVGGDGPVVVAVGIAAGSPGTIRAVSRRVDGTHRHGVDHADVAHELQRDVRALTDKQLCAAWRQRARAPSAARRADPGASIVAVRQCFPDEMERRDPAGFSTLLHADALTGDDSRRHLGR